ncbi:MAG TPA: hypothetical protein VGO48_03715 [Conexibacter sp.]|jgi:hypothetical protein|nr:hypothetical protein [Conexibacter sp.]
MHISVRAALLALLAGLTLAAGLGVASAGRLSVTSQQFRINSRPQWGSVGNWRIQCSTTMEGSFHARTIRKTLSSLIGLITRVAVNHPSCFDTSNLEAADMTFWNGSERILGTAMLTSLPWHVTYEGCQGTLPDPAAVIWLIEGFKFSISNPSRFCLAQYGNGTEFIRARLGINGVHEILSWEFEGNAVLAPVMATGICPNPGNFTGISGEFRVLGSTTTRITITLI